MNWPLRIFGYIVGGFAYALLSWRFSINLLSWDGAFVAAVFVLVSISADIERRAKDGR